MIYRWLILTCWLVFVVTWAVFACTAKRTIKHEWACGREIALRLGILVLVLLALRFIGFSRAAKVVRVYAVNRNPVAGLIGVALCAFGVGVAVLARIHLGRNWGLPMSRKEKPDLVTTGPYAAVRHPIYAGLLLAILGSAVGQSLFWVLPLVMLGPYFIHSAWCEEKLMTEQFPDQYPAYTKRTKMLLPYIL